MDKPPVTVNSVAHALRTLEYLSAGERPIGLNAISEAVELPRATTLRILNTLIAHGYVWKLDKRYGLSLRLLELAEQTRQGHHIRAAAEAPLRSLATATRLTAHLAMLDGSKVGYLAKVDPDSALRMASYVGWRGPLHCTATGKAILSQREPNVIRSLLTGDLEQFTDRTITDAEQLLAELANCRESGYAVDAEELADGLTCVAVPLPGQVEVAVSVAGPSQHIPPQRIPELVQLIRSAADAIVRTGFPAAASPADR